MDCIIPFLNFAQALQIPFINGKIPIHFALRYMYDITCKVEIKFILKGKESPTLCFTKRPEMITKVLFRNHYKTTG